MIAVTFRPSNFYDLPHYFHRESGRSDTAGPRVTWCEAFHLPGTDPHVVGRVMEATAAANPRCRYPLLHIVVAWHADDRPSEREMRESLERVLRELGMEEHLVYAVGHGDREHSHLHALVCRVHPHTNLAVDIWRVRRRIAGVLRRLEREHGWKENPNQLAWLPDQRPADRTQSLTPAEYRSWARTGFSLDDDHLPVRWVIQRRAGEHLRRYITDLDRARLEAELTALGIHLEPRMESGGDGRSRLRGYLVVADGRRARLSQIDRDAPAALLYPDALRAARYIQRYVELDDLHAEAHRIATLLGNSIPGPHRTQLQIDTWSERLRAISNEIGDGRPRREAREAMHNSLTALPPTHDHVAQLYRGAGAEVLRRSARAMPAGWQHALDQTRDQDDTRRPDGLRR